MKWIDSSRVSLAMSGTALFVALGGTAVAVSQVGTSQIRNSAITSAKLKNGAVSNAKLAKGSVGNGKLANGAVSNSKLANGSVDSPKLASGAVATSNLATGAVGSAQLADGGVAGSDIASAAISSGQLAGGAVATEKLADGAVTNPKLDDNAVTDAKLAANAVTSADVADGSLTAGDVAPNTFLAANGTAINSSELGGAPAGDFVTGGGRLVSGRLTLPANGSVSQLLELGFGHISASCAPGVLPRLRYVAELTTENLTAWTTNFGTATDIQTSNNLTGGTFFEETHNVTTPQSVTWQAAFNDGTTDSLATAWTTGQDEGGSCVFTGQAYTSLG